DCVECRSASCSASLYPERWWSVRFAKRKAQEVLNQVTFLDRREIQIETGVVVVDDRRQRWKTTIVVEPSLHMREQRANRRCAIAEIRRAVGLKRVNAHLIRLVEVPAGIGPQRFDVTVVASRLAAEQFVSSSGRGLIETAGRRLR